MSRRPIIGVVGGGGNTVRREDQEYEDARRVGELIAKGNAVLLCGGGSGIMEAVACGARSKNVPTIGIIPTVKGDRKPNQYIDCAIYTGLGDARNFINASAPDVMIAMKGGPGTLSEIALALKIKKPVICLGYWKFLLDAGYKVEYKEKPEEAIEAAYKIIGTEGKSSYPDLPGQERQGQEFNQFIFSVSEKKNDGS
jgi:uncharacterized protein (TIGR00725 family)